MAELSDALVKRASDAADELSIAQIDMDRARERLVAAEEAWFDSKVALTKAALALALPHERHGIRL